VVFDRTENLQEPHSFPDTPLVSFVCGLGPGEWLGALVVAVDVGTDRGLQVGDVGEGAAADCLAGDDAEEDLHHVQPRAAGGREMQCHSGVFAQPGFHAGVLVGGVVVADDAQRTRGWDLEEPQKAAELGFCSFGQFWAIDGN
jgi:hypothetical protein